MKKYNHKKAKVKTFSLLEYLQICSAQNFRHSVNALNNLKIHHVRVLQ